MKTPQIPPYPAPKRHDARRGQISPVESVANRPVRPCLISEGRSSVRLALTRPVNRPQTARAS